MFPASPGAAVVDAGHQPGEVPVKVTSVGRRSQRTAVDEGPANDDDGGSGGLRTGHRSKPPPPPTTPAPDDDDGDLAQLLQLIAAGDARGSRHGDPERERSLMAATGVAILGDRRLASRGE